ncbi:hypothetical protein PHMEG_0005725 [Phytophthora megakarya]|uniref:cellulose 1,4-beta-cellobiosidase (non-reducing end) n=1 Tax=Phytophthora megakarya TaxID=4795 RepID=A0A225WSC0_9STRA|nr:hypothetical protein PHMEG_0005725 [Phytophthora megakarya]
MGNKGFYGPGKKFEIDTTLRDGRQHGHSELVEIRRLYKQDDRLVANPSSTGPALNSSDSITDKICKASKSAFDENPNLMGVWPK